MITKKGRISRHLTKFLSHFWLRLTGRRSVSKQITFTSLEYNPKAGVPQGSILGRRYNLINITWLIVNTCLRLLLLMIRDTLQNISTSVLGFGTLRIIWLAFGEPKSTKPNVIMSTSHW